MFLEFMYVVADTGIRVLFFLLNTIPLYGYTPVCLSVHQLMHIPFSSFFILWGTYSHCSLLHMGKEQICLREMLALYLTSSFVEKARVLRFKPLKPFRVSVLSWLGH